ncbi:MAG: hypothetical protein JRC87_06160 [Deltaproteobacteria bacterium]|nr:hypothetical protein [Deltaproteobacteria bacterium]
MKTQPAQETIMIPNKSEQDNAVIDFVSELLAMTLAEQGEEMIVETRAEDFVFDTGSGIQTTASLEAVIKCEDVATDDKLEVTLSGTVTNLQGEKETFTLFFFTRLDEDETTSPNHKDRTGFTTRYLLIQFEKASKLFDSVFELNLYRKDQAGEQQSMGQGRGYLLFGNDPVN